MTVKEFCLRHTQVGELVVFRESGYIVGVVLIDIEDLFYIPQKFQERTVTNKSWEEVPLTTEHGDTVHVPCHIIDFK